MPLTLEQVGRQILSSLHGVLVGGDARVPADPAAKISWCQPGIPFSPADFEFGSNAMFRDGVTAENARRLSRQAFDFATIVDFVPDVSGVYSGDAQQTIWRATGNRLSTIYGEILHASKVVQDDLTEAEKTKLEKFRNFLFTQKKFRNEVTEEETTRTVPGRVFAAYQEARAAYLRSVTNYNSKRIQAQVATGEAGAAAVLDFQLNGANYAAEVDIQLQRWAAEGYKNEVEQALAYINQVTLRSMALWKQGLLDAFDRSLMTDAQSGSQFHYTTFSPARLAEGDGWTQFTQSHSSYRADASTYSSSWSGGGGIGFGFWRFGGGAGGSTSRESASTSIQNLKISFDLTQALIVRPWFFPELFSNRGWKLDPGHGWNFDQMPSDGAANPAGVLIGYPTQAVFVRNLVVESVEFASAFSRYASEVHGSASVGWGPFSFGGSYSRAESETHTDISRDEAKVEAKGMQLVAFVNRLIPKSPDPLPAIPPERFA